MKKIYNKLVRDRMIDIYKHDVENKVSASGYSVRYLKKEEILEQLQHKLHEETKELLDVYAQEDTTKLKEEVADVIEVLDAMLHHHGITLDEVLVIRETKKAKRGGFEEGLFLESIDYFK
jgi:predicted house-cleaning noncanonical NTP pyrophosphatase (MazG superfamily)